MAAVLALLAACGTEHEYRPQWVIRSQVVFLASDLRAERKPPPAGAFRLWFPYVSGDFYGPPTTGSFYDVVAGADGRFTLDLNHAHDSVVRSLQRTAFSMRSLWIGPAEARLARLLPFVMQADGIEPLDRTDWVDADSRERLMLVYFDRRARVVGHTRTLGTIVHYDVISEGPGYVWISEQLTRNGSKWSASRPARVLLAVTPFER